MKLTKELLHRLEQSQRVTLTPEQHLILLYWYGHEPRYGWDEGDFLLGIHEVMHYYPDHRLKPPPDLLITRNEEMGLTVRLREGGEGQ